MTRRQRLAWITAVAAPPALTLALIAVHGVNVPQWDQWAMPSLFRAFDLGTLEVADFWAQRDEHRPVVPQAIAFGLAQLTDWNIRAELFLGFGVAVVTFALLAVLLRRTLDRDGFVIASVVASVVFFSPMQWENWMWGWQLGWFLSNLAALGAFWALVHLVDRARLRGLAVAALCAVVATFSLGQGLLVWPVGLALLVLRGGPWRLWALLSVAAIGAYLSDYDGTGTPSKTAFLEHPLEFVKYICLYVGRPFGFDNATGAAAGVLLLATFAVAAAYLVAQRRDEELRARTHVWLGLGLYVAGAALMTAVARVSFGAAQAASSRYTGMGALLAIATLALLFALARSGAFRRQVRQEAAARRVPVLARRRSMVLLAAPLLVAGLVNTGEGIGQMGGEGDELRAAQRCLRSAQTVRDPCFADPQSGVPRQQFEGLLYLRRRGWAGF